MATTKQRQRQLARAKWERQQARRAEREHRSRAVRRGALIGLAVVVVGVLLGLGLRQLVRPGATGSAAAPPVPPAAAGPFDHRLERSAA